MPVEKTEAQAHAEGEARAAEARAVVARQLTEGLLERAVVGAPDVIGVRVIDLAHARRTRDVKLIRAAAMELSLAAAEYAVKLDSEHPALAART